MSAKGCHHLQTFKRSQKNLESFKWIHMVFVISGTPKTRKAKVCDRVNFLLLCIIEFI